MKRTFRRSVPEDQSINDTMDHIEAIIKLNLLDPMMVKQSQIDITIEVKEVLLCRKCGNPYDDDMIWSGRRIGWVHNKCPRDSKNLLLCDICGKPSDTPPSSAFVTSFSHVECIRRREAEEEARKVKDFYQAMDQVPDVLKEDKKIEKLRAPFMISYKKYPEMIYEKINELIDRFNRLNNG